MSITAVPEPPDDDEPYSDTAGITFKGATPKDIDAERAVLGGMLLAPRVIDEVADIVVNRDFYDPRHELIFDAVTYMHWNRQPVDAITVADYLDRKGELRRAGGQAYLHQLIASIPTAANAPYYSGFVSDKAVLRRLVEAGTRIVQMGLGFNGSGGAVDDVVGAAQTEVDTVARGQVTELVSAADVIDEVIEWTHSEKVALSTPWPSVNEILVGLEPGKVYTVAARPGGGKSIALLDLILWFMRKHHKAAALCSMEMDRNEVMMRMVANISNVSYAKVKNAKEQTRIEREHVTEAVQLIKRLPTLWIEDKPDQTVENMRSFARQAANRSDLGIVGIDYLQLFKPSPGRNFGTREQEVSHMSRQVKMTAKALKVPVVDLAQLNRVEGRPKMNNLRESGSIEQDSDVVILLHRDTDESTGQPLDDLMGYIAKHRGGPMGGFSLYFDGPHMRFTEHPEPGQGF